MRLRQWIARQVRLVNIGPIWITRQFLEDDPIEIWRRQVLSDRTYCTWAEEHQPSFRSYCDVDLRSSFARFANEEYQRIMADR